MSYWRENSEEQALVSPWRASPMTQSHSLAIDLLGVRVKLKRGSSRDNIDPGHSGPGVMCPLLLCHSRNGFIFSRPAPFISALCHCLYGFNVTCLTRHERLMVFVIKPEGEKWSLIKRALVNYLVFKEPDCWGKYTFLSYKLVAPFRRSTTAVHNETFCLWIKPDRPSKGCHFSLAS